MPAANERELGRPLNCETERFDIWYCGRRKKPFAMTIEITSPEVEALNRQRMEAASFAHTSPLVTPSVVVAGD
jgi:hypothetical protein